MPVSDQFARLAPYAGRLLDDHAVQAQLDRAVSNLRDGTRRARGKGAKKAVKDRRTRRKLITAASAAIQAARTLSEPPAPKRHLGRRIVVLSLLGGGAVIVYRQLADATPTLPDG
jgi:hypothetical protein